MPKYGPAMPKYGSGATGAVGGAGSEVPDEPESVEMPSQGTEVDELTFS